MTQKIINVKVHRFDPLADKAPHFQTYEVPLEVGMSVLDVLDYIYENLDSSLSYFNHATCRRGVCVRCTLKVNNQVVVSCQTEVKEDITITPRCGEIVRDLVILPRSRKSQNIHES